MELTNEFEVPVPVDRAWEVLTDVERIAPCMPGAQLQEVEGDEFRGIVKVKVGPITAQYKGAATFVEKDQAAHRMVLKASGRDTRGQGNASATITATLVPQGDRTAVTVVTDLTVTGKVAQFGRGVLADVSSKLLGQFVDCLHGKLGSGEAEAAVPAAGPSETPPATTGPAPAEAPAAAAEGPAAAPVTTAPAPIPAPTDAPVGATAGSNGGGAAPAGGTVGAGAEASGPPRAQVRKIDSPEVEPVNLLDTAGAPLMKRALPVFAVLLLLLLLGRRRRRNG